MAAGALLALYIAFCAALHARALAALAADRSSAGGRARGGAPAASLAVSMARALRPRRITSTSAFFDIGPFARAVATRACPTSCRRCLASASRLLPPAAPRSDPSVRQADAFARARRGARPSRRPDLPRVRAVPARDRHAPRPTVATADHLRGPAIPSVLHRSLGPDAGPRLHARRVRLPGEARRLGTAVLERGFVVRRSEPVTRGGAATYEYSGDGVRVSASEMPRVVADLDEAAAGTRRPAASG